MQGRCTLHFHSGRTPRPCHRSPAKQYGPFQCLPVCRSHLLPNLGWCTVPNYYSRKSRRYHRSAATQSDRPLPANHTTTRICKHDRPKRNTHAAITPEQCQQRRRIHDDTQKHRQQKQTGESHTSTQVNKYQKYKRTPGTKKATHTESLNVAYSRR